MKICILSRDPKLYSTQRLTLVATLRGHEVSVVDPLRCYMNIASAKPVVFYRERPLGQFGAVIPRIGASVTFYATAVLRQFEMMGVFTLNESVAISRSRDKLRAVQILARKGIGLPVTGFAHSTKMTQDLIELVGRAPLVIKLLEGTQGRGTVFAETDQAAESVIDAFQGLDAHFLVQEFIKESHGAKIRCLVVGKKVMASVIRVPSEEESRTDLHKIISTEPIKITSQERRTAVKACKALGLQVAGVDLLRSNHGPVVIDVDSCPGLEVFERTLGEDFAKPIIEFIESKESRIETEGG